MLKKYSREILLRRFERERIVAALVSDTKVKLIATDSIVYKSFKRNSIRIYYSWEDSVEFGDCNDVWYSVMLFVLGYVCVCVCVYMYVFFFNARFLSLLIDNFLCFLKARYARIVWRNIRH